MVGQLERIECLWKFMVTMLQLINCVGNGFKVSRMVILALKTSLAVDSQKDLKTNLFYLFKIAYLYTQNAMSFQLQNYIHHAKEYLSLSIPQFISCSGISISS